MYRRILIHRSFLVVSMLTMLLFTNGTATSSKNTNYSDSLITVNGAQNIRFVEYEGTQQLTYSVKEKFPALDFVANLYCDLKSRGWIPMEENFLNPGMTTSHVSGWGGYEDRYAKPPKKVQTWQAQWESERGDVVCYSLKFLFSSNEKDIIADMEVFAVFVPHNLRKQFLGKETS